MRSFQKTFFLHAPVWLQNTFVSLYGLKIDRTRYGGAYKNYFKAVYTQYGYDNSALQSFMNERLMSTINNALVDIPYYKDTLKYHGIHIGDIRSIEDIERLPFLEKDVVRREPDRLVSNKYDRNSLLCIHTTGTTGTPLNIYCTPQVRQLNYAYYDRFLLMSDIKYEGKRATFGGRIIVHEAQQKPPFWRYSSFQKNLLFSSYHLTDENMPAYIEKLIDFNPDVIDAYPSSLFAVASYAEAHHIDLRQVTSGITTSAETLFPAQRQTIEAVFGVPVRDQYGAAEMCVFVGQCKEGSYHIHTDYGMLEFLRDDGSKAMPGEEAELVCTGFINPVMPLIRYRMGDRGVLSDKFCMCGSIFPVMEKIMGRMDDVIVTPDGRRIGRLSPVFKGFPVKEVQYIQRNIGTVEVQIVKDIGYSISLEGEVLKELRKRLGETISIHINYVNSISRGRGGKLKSIVSYVEEKNQKFDANYP